MKDYSIEVPIRGGKITVTLDKIIDSSDYEVQPEYVPNAVIDCYYAIKLLALEIKALKEEVKQQNSKFCYNCFNAKLYKGESAECFLPKNVHGDGLESPIEGTEVHKDMAGCRYWKLKINKKEDE